MLTNSTAVHNSSHKGEINDFVSLTNCIIAAF